MAEKGEHTRQLTSAGTYIHTCRYADCTVTNPAIHVLCTLIFVDKFSVSINIANACGYLVVCNALEDSQTRAYHSSTLYTTHTTQHTTHTVFKSSIKITCSRHYYGGVVRTDNCRSSDTIHAFFEYQIRFQTAAELVLKYVSWVTQDSLEVIPTTVVDTTTASFELQETLTS